MAITIQTTTYKVIYIYSRDAHPNLLKIGKTSVDAYNASELTDNCVKLQDATKERIKEAATFGITDLHILHTEVGYFVDSNGIEKSFDDHAVHEVLLNSGYIKADMTTVAGIPDEWFDVPLDKAIEAIKAVKEEKEKIDGPKIKAAKTPEIHFREEQELAISSTLTHYTDSKEKGSDNIKMLWNAKMRFGKTLCALELINRLDVQKVMILTHRPTVRSGWFDDYHLIKFNTEWQYGSKRGKKHAILNDKNNHYEDYVTGKDLETLQNGLKDNGTHYIYFASMQDLRGQKVIKDSDGNVISREWKDNNRHVYEIKWDLIIFDEAHEGTQTALGKEVIEGLTYNNDPLKLYLSGTPFNILSQFEPEEIFTWDYVMEQKAKNEWNSKHPNEPNPYEGLAKLNIYTYNLGEVFDNNPEYVKKTEDDYFNFAEFFRIFKGKKDEDGIEMPSGAEKGYFVHEKDVVAFLDLLCQKEPESQYPYSNDDFCNALSHTLWMLPGVTQAARLTTLINNHRLHTEYGFEVVNVAGEGNAIESADPDDSSKIEKKEKDALEKVKKALQNHKRTITLSCGKLTTGVSIPEWTGVFMLSGGYSTGAANYMQTIFRGQTPYKNGAIKANCYAFDFAPDRTLTVIDDYIKMQPSSRNGGKRVHGDRVKTVEDYLRFCPVISMKGSEEVEYDALTFIKRVNQAYDDHIIKNGFKSRYLFKNMSLFTQDDHDLLAKVENLIGGAKVNTNSDGTINMADNDLKGDKGKKRNGSKGDSKGTGSGVNGGSTMPKPRNPTKNQEQEQRRKSQRVLDAIFVRFPLLLFGAVEDADKITLDELLSENVIDNESWNEFMPKGFTKPIFNQIAHLIDIDNLISSTSVIISQTKDADKLPIQERIIEIVQMISKFHFTDNETVLTPWRVVNLHMAYTLGGYDFYDETHNNLLDAPVLREQEGITANLFCNPDAHVLEVNSKSGVYPLWIAYTFWALLRDSSLTFEEDWILWKKVVENNVYVVCKTRMAEKITKRVLCGYNNDIHANTVSFDNLTGILKDGTKRSSIVKKIRKQSTYGKSSKDMIKFEAVVGNPPYQITVAKKETENGQKRVSNIFHHFQILSDELGDFTSLIYPGGRWIHQSGKGLTDFGKKQINDSRLRRMIYYPVAGDIFKDAGIPDGISIVLKDKNKKTKGFEYLYGNSVEVYPMDNPGDELMPLNPMDLTIVNSISSKVNEVEKFCYLNASVLSQKLFGIESDFVEKNPDLVRPYNEGDSFDQKTEIKLFTNDKAGKAGRAKWYITKRDVIKTATEYIDQWKVIVSSANAGGQKRSSQLEIIDNHSAFGRSRVALKAFKGEGAQQQAENFFKYVQSELIRFAFLMTDESLTSLAKRVPDIIDYSNDNGYIDFSGDINAQIYELFGVKEQAQIEYIRYILANKADGLANENDEEIDDFSNGPE